MPKIQDNQENANKCICPACPSYTECLQEKMSKLFCAQGKTECKISMNGCNCGGCPVHTIYGLEQGYYCLQGSADEIDK